MNFGKHNIGDFEFIEFLLNKDDSVSNIQLKKIIIEEEFHDKVRDLLIENASFPNVKIDKLND